MVFGLGRQRAKKEILPTLQRYSSLHGRMVLDLGCGYGGPISALAEENHAMAVGVDLTVQLAKAKYLCTKALCGPGTGIHFIRADASRLPFRKNTFSVVVLCDILEHADDPEAVMSETHRVVEQDGLIYVGFTPYHGPWGGHLWNYLPIPYIHWLLPKNVVMRLISALGDAGSLFTARDAAELYSTLSKLKIETFQQIAKRFGMSVLEEEIDSFFGKIALRNWLARLSAMEYTAVLQKTGPAL